jgi:hypothetical protein
MLKLVHGNGQLHCLRNRTTHRNTAAHTNTVEERRFSAASSV